ncbi:MAG: hypothetical protein H7A33_05520 [Deltaproteobacteria bacterium]|nr:hypothetical protein [Deltaproteobacteria bacterium]
MAQIPTRKQNIIQNQEELDRLLGEISQSLPLADKKALLKPMSNELQEGILFDAFESYLIDEGDDDTRCFCFDDLHGQA